MEKIENRLQKLEDKAMNKNWLKKYWQLVLAVLFLLLFATQYVNTERQAGIIAEQTKNLKESKKAFVQKERQFKELQKELAKNSEEKQAKIDSLHKDNDKKDKQLAEFRAKNKKQKEQLQNNADYVKFLKERYDTQAVVETPNGVELQKDVPKMVTHELADKDLCAEENTKKDEIIKNKDSEIEQQKGLTQNALTEKDGALNLLSEAKEVQKDSEELIKNQKKNISQLKFKNGLKTVVIPVGFVLGAVGGFLLAN